MGSLRPELCQVSPLLVSNDSSGTGGWRYPRSWCARCVRWKKTRAPAAPGPSSSRQAEGVLHRGAAVAVRRIRALRRTGGIAARVAARAAAAALHRASAAAGAAGLCHAVRILIARLELTRACNADPRDAAVRVGRAAHAGIAAGEDAPERVQGAVRAAIG